MTKRRLLILILIAIAGYGALYILFPRFNSAAQWGFAIDRDAAIARAREFAASQGIDLSDSRITVTARYDRKLENYLKRKQTLPASRLLSPIIVRVKFNNLRSGHSLVVSLSPKGNLLGFNQKIPPKTGQTEQRLPAVEESRLLAEASLTKLFPDSRQYLSPLSDAGSTINQSNFEASGSDQDLKVGVAVGVEGGKVRSVTLEPDFTDRYDSEYEARRGRLATYLSRSGNLIIWPAMIMVTVLYFVGLARKKIQHRLTLTFLGLIFLLIMLKYCLGSFRDDFLEDLTIGGGSSVNYWVTVIFSWAILVLIAFVVAGSLYFCWSAGTASSIKVPNRRTISLELLLRGKVLTKPVVKSVLAGLMIGGLLAAIPYLTAATGLFSAAEVDASGLEDLFISRTPALSSPIALHQYLLFIIFALICQLIDAYLKRPMLARLSIYVVALTGALAIGLFYLPASALVVASTIFALVLTAVYLNFDLLTVMVGSMASQTALGSAGLLAQSSESLHGSGYRALAGLAVMVLIALVGLRKVREIREEEVAVPAWLLTTRAERERLKAEFGVARRAQQQLLPNVSPQLSGFEIAAVCHPSREVGGDMYDFIRFPDGKLGIVVADVSGKGVPASLYMTLTKGLLDSVSEEKSDPGEILCEVNRHLYDVCRRKVFVTLFLGVIDPARRILIYARAGHNPTVFRKAKDGQPILLKSRGMGLGLSGGKVFDQSINVESVQLEPNDLLLFYSDGITEAMNSRNEEYGEERLMNLSTRMDGMKAEVARDMVMADVGKFLGSVPPQDDQTLVVVRAL